MKGLFLQETKTLFKSPTSISLLIIPIVLLVGLGFLLPAAWIIPSSITIGIVASVLLYFGGSIEEIKRTSFMKAISLTRLSKFSFLATKILFAIILSTFIVLWVLFFGWIFTDVLHIMATTFEPILGPHASGVSGALEKIPFNVKWSDIKWITIFYSGAITIAVTITLSFVFVTLSKSSLSFYLMSFGYLLAMILFGGIIMPSFLISKQNQGFKTLYYFIPNYYTNNVMAAAFNQGPGVIARDALGFIKPLLKNGIVIPGLDKLVPNDKAGKLVRDFLYGWLVNDGGRMDKLNQWWNETVLANWNAYNINEKTYLNSMYKIFKLPSTGALGIELHYDSWKSMLTNFGVWKSFINIFDNAIFKKFAKPVFLDLFTQPNFLHLFSQAAINKNHAELGSWVINHSRWVIFAKPDWKTTFFTLGIGTGLKGALALNWVPPWNGHAASWTIASFAGNFIDQVSTMFKVPFDLKTPSGLADLVVPWTETGVFLGVSIIFFKWS